MFVLESYAPNPFGHSDAMIRGTGRTLFIGTLTASLLHIDLSMCPEPRAAPEMESVLYPSHPNGAVCVEGFSVIQKNISS